ncbi:hypothetical protein O0235_10605 [Tepidiforma flava]|uniref:Uncharacterized protein n=1 Tax=Tepidiforma flava TaxID=3004094 RepID=A0ABY7M3W9_9CHLR|nr:hypothetical protein [Tepidiforma flava]WBL35236.1 hypothetical protein O0235_10605 [Tepidiforma flava]
MLSWKRRSELVGLRGERADEGIEDGFGGFGLVAEREPPGEHDEGGGDRDGELDEAEGDELGVVDAFGAPAGEVLLEAGRGEMRMMAPKRKMTKSPVGWPSRKEMLVRRMKPPGRRASHALCQRKRHQAASVGGEPGGALHEGDEGEVVVGDVAGADDV